MSKSENRSVNSKMSLKHKTEKMEINSDYGSKEDSKEIIRVSNEKLKNSPLATFEIVATTMKDDKQISCSPLSLNIKTLALPPPEWYNPDFSYIENAPWTMEIVMDKWLRKLNKIAEDQFCYVSSGQNTNFIKLLEICSNEYKKATEFQSRVIAAFKCLDSTNDYLLSLIHTLRTIIAADLSELASKYYILQNEIFNNNPATKMSALASDIAAEKEINKNNSTAIIKLEVLMQKYSKLFENIPELYTEFKNNQIKLNDANLATNKLNQVISSCQADIKNIESNTELLLRNVSNLTEKYEDLNKKCVELSANQKKIEAWNSNATQECCNFGARLVKLEEYVNNIGIKLRKMDEFENRKVDILDKNAKNPSDLYAHASKSVEDNTKKIGNAIEELKSIWNSGFESHKLALENIRGKVSELKKNNNNKSNAISQNEIISNKKHCFDHLNKKTCKIWKCKGDGNCLFRALSKSLFDDEEKHNKIRNEIADFIEQNQDHFGDFIDEEKFKFPEYVKNIRNDAVWGDNLELIAASRLYNRQIIIYDEQLKLHKTFLEENNKDKDIIRLLYDGTHYDCIFIPESEYRALSSQNMQKPNQKKLCFTCGKYGHFANSCSYTCFICGRRGHLEENCYNEKKCRYCKKIGHTSTKCFKKNFHFYGESRDTGGLRTNSLFQKKIRYIKKRNLPLEGLMLPAAQKLPNGPKIMGQ